MAFNGSFNAKKIRLLLFSMCFLGHYKSIWLDFSEKEGWVGVIENSRCPLVWCFWKGPLGCLSGSILS